MGSGSGGGGWEQQTWLYWVISLLRGPAWTRTLPDIAAARERVVRGGREGRREEECVKAWRGQERILP